MEVLKFCFSYWPKGTTKEAAQQALDIVMANLTVVEINDVKGKEFANAIVTHPINPALERCKELAYMCVCAIANANGFVFPVTQNNRSWDKPLRVLLHRDSLAQWPKATLHSDIFETATKAFPIKQTEAQEPQPEKSIGSKSAEPKKEQGQRILASAKSIGRNSSGQHEYDVWLNHDQSASIYCDPGCEMDLEFTAAGKKPKKLNSVPEASFSASAFRVKARLVKKPGGSNGSSIVIKLDTPPEQSGGKSNLLTSKIW